MDPQPSRDDWRHGLSFVKGMYINIVGRCKGEFTQHKLQSTKKSSSIFLMGNVSSDSHPYMVPNHRSEHGRIG